MLDLSNIGVSDNPRKHRTGGRETGPEAAAVTQIRDGGSGGINGKDMTFRNVYKAN